MKYLLLYLLITCSMKIHAQNLSPSNQHFWHTVETSAEAAKIWSVWTDVSHWKLWDTGLKDAQIYEPFALGAEGILISLQDRKSKFKIVDYQEGESYTFRTRLPLGSLYVKRYLKKSKSKTVFTHEVWFKGLTAGFFAKKFGPGFRQKLPEVMNTIKVIAEQK